MSEYYKSVPSVSALECGLLYSYLTHFRVSDLKPSARSPWVLAVVRGVAPLGPVLHDPCAACGAMWFMIYKSQEWGGPRTQGNAEIAH